MIEQFRIGKTKLATDRPEPDIPRAKHKTCPILAFTSAPAHMIQGSSVT